MEIEVGLRIYRFLSGALVEPGNFRYWPMAWTSMRLSAVCPERRCLLWSSRRYGYRQLRLSTFLDAIVEIKPVSIDPLKSSCESFDLRSNNHLKGLVYLWENCETVQGLLKAIDENGKSWFFELEHFLMMNLTLARPDNSIPKGSSESSGISSAEDKPKSGETSVSKEWVETINPGMFLLLNKPCQALFVTLF